MKTTISINKLQKATYAIFYFSVTEESIRFFNSETGAEPFAETALFVSKELLAE